ncbi:sigma-54-dependent Fis family transcriptional regulator [bacterium M00.F.Ca.ET.228.01.1.1]|uniref:sigma-54-dependent Fis family transcriptional regulator n=1 Tax=Paraburkholderia phenoliruptrix TaxID=252970 RepID=UPI001092CA9E|nr:sigma-54-dependent Fis family transcriptional regulator [Paraburkholderia phenoliruptrix]TGP42481.1 sigma-54-dependent Fis family transcriptional regulator [bacterium M00.F.Ca.ET.228.01.1.1]TGS00132.1 sigma-54-dependent Fis family transcriptional regulator [bacterium M00.F.Ca.ET.191.01.1.1]TGU04452.1 sigma-54-dependent Fis family transcriptional regulator [bacterium M00.F.Ca.ET.155.01.1.1]MBW0449960.1 sigma-54-dependent Fis family transcriptional regulator [Paraburkholderia phenoliruptrix]M
MDQLQRQHIETVLLTTTSGSAAGARAHDAIIQTSWQRCVHQYGLDPARMQEARILPQFRLREHQQRIDDFTRIARHGLDTLYSQVGGMGYVVLLTDADGVTVDFRGDANTDAALRRAGLYLGAEWSENGAGTCAVGTALATGQALTVHQDDHFDATHIPLTCTAAPLFDSYGQLNAILDISALCSPQAKYSQMLALQLVRMYANRIEDANFLRRHRQDWMLKLSPAPEFLDVNPEYLIALDAGGRISGHNRRAQQMLIAEPGVETMGQSLLGMRFDELFDARAEDLGRFVYSRPSEQRVLRLSRSGKRLYLSVMPPVLRLHHPMQDDVAPPLPAELAALCGGDAALQQQLQRAARLIDSPINLLINGETGSGKEFLAKALHRASSRRNGPFIAVNCAAIPEALIESELFGHLPNSFSGAGSKPKRGLIEEANGGTLFLDEIGDMPRELQSRLLRVLSEGEVLAIGASRPVPVDVRVISATHHPLDQLISTGRFREDLYYRLNGARLVLPPLRERSDLDWLVQKLLAVPEAGSGFTISEAARARLHRHRWPGNLRELRNALEYARAVCSHKHIEADDLPEGIGDTAKETVAEPACSDPAAHPAHVSQGNTLPPEGIVLMQHLRASGWNLSAVAREIGISRMTLYRRMARYGIQSPNRSDAKAGDISR